MTLRNKIAGEMPRLKPTDSAETITNHQRELARRIIEARASAKQGDIFTPHVTAEFRRLIALTMQGHRARRIRQSLRHAEPDTAVPLRVNGEYPPKVPLQSTPPSLLLNLPRLPKELDYRIAGHSLVFRDVDANLIVDFIPDAIP
jgi:hypothetical protein